MLKHLKKLTEETIHENPWWKYKHDTYELPSGNVGEYWYGETHGVALIIPQLPDGRLVLTLQHRYLEDKQSIEFPAGGIEAGEEALDAAKRELLEEVGCIAGEFVKMGIFQPSNGLIRDESHVFRAYVTEQVPTQIDESEEIEILYRRPDEFEHMVRSGEIWDGQTLAAWMLSRSYFLQD